MARHDLGAWTLPSGNRLRVFVDLGAGRLVFEWDTPPEAGWPAEDLAHYQTVYPEIMQTLAHAIKQRVFGVAPTNGHPRVAEGTDR